MVYSRSSNVHLLKMLKRVGLVSWYLILESLVSRFCNGFYQSMCNNLINLAMKPATGIFKYNINGNIIITLFFSVYLSVGVQHLPEIVLKCLLILCYLTFSLTVSLTVSLWCCITVIMNLSNLDSAIIGPPPTVILSLSLCLTVILSHCDTIILLYFRFHSSIYNHVDTMYSRPEPRLKGNLLCVQLLKLWLNNGVPPYLECPTIPILSHHTYTVPPYLYCPTIPRLSHHTCVFW